MLRGEPNPEMSSHTLRSVLQCHALLWGNAYAEIQRDNGARPMYLWPRNPARTRPVRLTHDARIEGTMYPMGTLVYHTSETLGDEISFQDDLNLRISPERIILAEDMVHIVGLSLDGRLGQSTVWLAREIIGLALASEKFGAKFFGNGAVPRGILTTPGILEPKALENLRRSWQEAHGGENAQRTAILEQGMDYKPIGMDPEKSQFLETRHYQRSAIAALFNVPLHMIGEKEAAKSSVEQTSIEFLQYCLNPWLDAWEQELKRKLFSTKNAATKSFFVKFDVQRLLYPDAESRAKFYTSGKTSGYLNSNDIREMEDMNPIEDGSGDVYWMPINMQDAAHPMTAPHLSGGPFPGAVPAQQPEKIFGGAPQNRAQRSTQLSEGPKTFDFDFDVVHRFSKVFYGQFLDATHRILKRDTIPAERFRRCFEPVLGAVVLAISGELNPAGPWLSLTDLRAKTDAYLEGMRFNLQGVTPALDETYATRETLRAVETFGTFVAQAYNERHNPNVGDQQRHPDGTWHDGSTNFYLGRHATTDDDVNGVWSGQRDVPINAQGETETAAAATKLKGLGIKRIVTSDLLRTRQTAHRYAQALGNIPVVYDQRLRALNLGELEGLNEKQNADRLKLYLDAPDKTIPGGESIDQYRERVNAALDEARVQNELAGPTLALTHSSAVANYLGKVRGKQDNLERSSELLSPAGVVQLNGKKVQVITGTLKGGDAA